MFLYARLDAESQLDGVNLDNSAALNLIPSSLINGVVVVNIGL